MAHCRLTTFAASGGDPRYSDAEMTLVLDLAVRRLLTAEEAV
jgi:hypothetical protein